MVDWISSSKVLWHSEKVLFNKITKVMLLTNVSLSLSINEIVRCEMIGCLWSLANHMLCYISLVVMRHRFPSIFSASATRAFVLKSHNIYDFGNIGWTGHFVMMFQSVLPSGRFHLRASTLLELKRFRYKKKWVWKGNS